MRVHIKNDGRYPDESKVEIKFLGSWIIGTVIGQADTNEWEVEVPGANDSTLVCSRTAIRHMVYTNPDYPPTSMFRS